MCFILRNQFICEHKISHDRDVYGQQFGWRRDGRLCCCSGQHPGHLELYGGGGGGIREEWELRQRRLPGRWARHTHSHTSSTKRALSPPRWKSTYWSPSPPPPPYSVALQPGSAQAPTTPSYSCASCRRLRRSKLKYIYAAVVEACYYASVAIGLR